MLDNWWIKVISCSSQKKYRGNFKSRRDRECLYANKEDDSNEQVVSVSDDEIVFVAIKE